LCNPFLFLNQNVAALTNACWTCLARNPHALPIHPFNERHELCR
jgi:hypothetical protein